MASTQPCDPVDASEIAARLGKSRNYTANQITRMAGFPPPQDRLINGGRWWQWGEVEAWARGAGYLPDP